MLSRKAARHVIIIGLALVLLVAGYITPDPQARIWSVLLMFLEFMFSLAERVTPPGKVLQPGSELEAHSEIVDVVSRAKGYLKVIDPYPSEVTLRVLNAAPEGVPVDFLTTTNVNKKDLQIFEAFAARLTQDRSEFEVRYASNGIIHDRFILTEPHGWLSGQSIKDSGNKLTILKPLTPDENKELVMHFDSIWNGSRPL